ncbi:MAG: sensor histidine kinase, partial [Oscillospiraceae bacterium]
MRILANKKIKRLFGRAVLLMLALALVSAVFIGFKLKNAALYMLLCFLCTNLLLLALGYRYFKE